MTPSKEKLPLPSSTSMALPTQPTTFDEWRTALRWVKLLFQKRQWRECTARCNKLLLEAKTPTHPAHLTYLHFYSALSTELVARSSQNVSATKISLLERVKEFYLNAAASLPDPEFGFSNFVNHHSDESSDNTSQTSNPPSRPCTPCPDRTSAPTYRSSLSSVESTEDVFNNQEDLLKPSPLLVSKVHKFTRGFDAPANSTPTRPISAASHKSVAFSVSTSVWLQSRSLDRYNAHLASFADMLDYHIRVVDTLIRDTETAQANRYTCTRLPSYADEETKVADRRVRIERLKAKGWKRERFAPGRYQELCERALAEL
ncbi:hypothetical protein MMC08_001280 [Hypocenomyce scalaris]|nr:hypothetical protein [Hypocenomyce scalaris]